MDDFLKYGLIIVAVATIALLGVVAYRASHNPISSESKFQIINGTGVYAEQRLSELCSLCKSRQFFNRDCYLVTLTITSGTLSSAGPYADFENFASLSTGKHELKISNKEERCIIKKIP